MRNANMRLHMKHYAMWQLASAYFGQWLPATIFDQHSPFAYGYGTGDCWPCGSDEFAAAWKQLGPPADIYLRYHAFKSAEMQNWSPGSPASHVLQLPTVSASSTMVQPAWWAKAWLVLLRLLLLLLAVDEGLPLLLTAVASKLLASDTRFGLCVAFVVSPLMRCCLQLLRIMQLLCRALLAIYVAEYTSSWMLSWLGPELPRRVTIVMISCLLVLIAYKKGWHVRVNRSFSECRPSVKRSWRSAQKAFKRHLQRLRRCGVCVMALLRAAALLLRMAFKWLLMLTRVRCVVPDWYGGRCVERLCSFAVSSRGAVTAVTALTTAKTEVQQPVRPPPAQQQQQQQQQMQLLPTGNSKSGKHKRRKQSQAAAASAAALTDCVATPTDRSSRQDQQHKQRASNTAFGRGRHSTSKQAGNSK
jgi:hypothetical protein